MSKFIIKISFLLLLLIPSLSWVEEYDNLEGKIIDCYYNEIRFGHYRHIIKFKKIERLNTFDDGSGTWYNEYRAEVTSLHASEESEIFLNEGIIQYKNSMEWIWFDRPRLSLDNKIPLDKRYKDFHLMGPKIFKLRINRQTLKPELSKYTIDDDSFCKIIDEKGADSRILYLKKLYNDIKNTQNENELKEKEQLKKNQKI